MKKIWESSSAYLISKRYVVWAFREYFSRVIITGAENIPRSGPVIFAPNHLNALMDALAILALPPFHLPKVFLARADIFKLPALVVKFIRFTKILPAYRIRDGYDQLDRNRETFTEAENTLLSDAALGIMPEGNQGEERNIRPLVKGIFRIAFSAQQRMPEGKSVKIVPVGLEYGDIIECQHPLILKIGKPIDVADYMVSYTENQVKATNELKNKLRSQLEEITVHLPAGENYTLYDDCVELVSPLITSNIADRFAEMRLFNARRRVAASIRKLESEKPGDFIRLKELHGNYTEIAKQIQLPGAASTNLLNPVTSTWYALLKILIYSLLQLPGAILNFLPYIVIKSIPRLAGIKYTGFYSSVYYVAALVVLPFYYLTGALLLGAFSPLSWWTILFSIPVIYLSGKLSIQLFRKTSSLVTELRLMNIRKKNPQLVASLLTIRQNIKDLVLLIHF